MAHYMVTVETKKINTKMQKFVNDQQDRISAAQRFLEFLEEELTEFKHDQKLIMDALYNSHFSHKLTQ